MTCLFDNKWYALFGMTGEEDKIRDRLLYRFKDDSLKIIVPKRRMVERKNGVWQTKIRSLFPGYVLLNGEIGVREYYALKDIPGLFKILSDESGPTRIHEDEISVISRLMYNGVNLNIR